MRCVTVIFAVLKPGSDRRLFQLMAVGIGRLAVCS